MNEWQPGKTAPRDGASVIGLWFDEVRNDHMFGIISLQGAAWLENGREVPAPTHWMPLPAPPA